MIRRWLNRLTCTQKRRMVWGLAASTPWFFVFSFLWLPPMLQTFRGVMTAGAWMLLLLLLCTIGILLRSDKSAPGLAAKFMQLYLLLLSWNVILLVTFVRVIAEPYPHR